MLQTRMTNLLCLKAGVKVEMDDVSVGRTAHKNMAHKAVVDRKTHILVCK